MNALEKTAVKIIKEIKYLNLASITPNGEAWNSALFTAFDEDLNFYWLSWRENQHSVNVRNNKDVFITIYDSTIAPGTGVGVYFKGSVKELMNPIEMLKGLKVIYARSNKSMREVRQFLHNFPRRIYRFTPSQAWINGDSDIEGNFIDVRSELSLMDLRAGIRED